MIHERVMSLICQAHRGKEGQITPYTLTIHHKKQPPTRNTSWGQPYSFAKLTGQDCLILQVTIQHARSWSMEEQKLLVRIIRMQ